MADNARLRSGGARPGRGRGRGGDRDHQSARDDDPLGPLDRSAGRPGHCLAESGVGADLPTPPGRRTRGGDPPPHRPPPRPLLLRDEDRPPPRDDAGTARGLRTGRGVVWHRRQLPHLATDRREGPRHRPDQRQPHAPLRHRSPGMERRPLWDVRHPAGDPPRGAAVERGFRHDRPGPARRRGADRRLRRRPAGGRLRARMRHARGSQEHLRHRRLPALLDRRAPGAAG